MTGNPLSGHTKANESTMAGTATFTDGLTDGDHIQSPTLTNYLEGLHGNGILLEEDTAYGATNRNVPEDLPGVVEQNTNSDRIRVTGGTAIIDGVPFQFAGGPGSHIDIDLTTTSPNRRATYSALTSGQEALVVVYVSTKDSEGGSAVNNVQWEMGTAITTATNAYPTTPSAFLNDPKAATGLATDSTSFQSVVLAVLRVVYSASAPGDLKISVTESNDKRVFIRPSPIYLTSVTDGIVGATTAIDSHAEVDALITGTTGDLAGSRLGALWQSYNADGDTILYYSSKDSGGTRHTHVLGPVGYVTKSPSATTTFTFNEGQVFVLNPSTAMQFNPSGTFPLGHLVYVTNEAAHGTNGVTFDNAGIGIVLLGKESGVFVYTGSAWKNVMLASGAVSPNGHGASGNIQLSDGAGGFTSDSTLSYDTAANELTVDGKLTVTGLIDPTGLELSPQASNPASADAGVVDANTIWLDSGASNRPKIGSNAIIRAADNISELTNDSNFVDAAGAAAAAPATNLGYTASSRTVTSSTGTNAVITEVVAGGNSGLMTGTQATKLDGIATNATANAGTVTSISTTAPITGGTITTTGTIGIDAATTSTAGSMSSADKTKLDGIEANADVTDTANVTAAGALMDSEITNLADVKSFDPTDYATAAQGTTADSALQAIVEDTAPEVSADLSLGGNNIVQLPHVSSILKADASSALSAATAGTDYQEPLIFCQWNDINADITSNVNVNTLINNWSYTTGNTDIRDAMSSGVWTCTADLAGTYLVIAKVMFGQGTLAETNNVRYSMQMLNYKNAGGGTPSSGTIHNFARQQNNKFYLGHILETQFIMEMANTDTFGVYAKIIPQSGSGNFLIKSGSTAMTSLTMIKIA